MCGSLWRSEIETAGSAGDTSLLHSLTGDAFGGALDQVSGTA